MSAFMGEWLTGSTHFPEITHNHEQLSSFHRDHSESSVIMMMNECVDDLGYEVR